MFRHWKTPLTRAGLLAASFATSALLMAALGAAFHDASSEPWLSDTPQLRRALADCQARPARAGRHDHLHNGRRDCLRDWVAQTRQDARDSARMAALDPVAAGPERP